MKGMEITIIEVDQCLTDQCHSCTGYYKNDIFSSKIICRCKCHIADASNIELFVKVLSIGQEADHQTHT